MGSSFCHAGSRSGKACDLDRVTALFESAGHKSVMLFPISSQPSPRAVRIRDGAAARVPFISGWLLSDLRLVGFRREQVVQLRRIGKLDLVEPAAGVRVGIDQGRIIRDGLVDLYDLSSHG